MHFGDALTLLKAGHKLERKGWNGHGMWVELQTPDTHSKMRLPYLFLSYPDGRTVPWLASQTDMLEDDWQIKTAVFDQEVQRDPFTLTPDQVRELRDMGMWGESSMQKHVVSQKDMNIALRAHLDAHKKAIKKPHWTQTPAGKKILAKRKKAKK